MKKLMFILLLIIPTFVINAQESVNSFKHQIKAEKGIQFSDGTIQTTAAIPGEELASIQVIDHLYDRTEQAITTLAKALEVPAEHVYNVLVRQQIVQGISITLGMILSVLLSVISIMILLKVHNFETNSLYQNTEGYWVISIFLTIIAIVLLIVFISGGLPRLVNPEYGAIKDIMYIL